MLDRPNIKEASLIGGVNQDIEITLIGVVTVQDGTEDTRVPGTIGLDYAPDGVTMSGQCYRWFHGGSPDPSIAVASPDCSVRYTGRTFRSSYPFSS